MNKRLIKILNDNWGGIKDKSLLDCYNQTVLDEISCTIHTKIQTSCNYFILEKIEYESGNIENNQ